MWARRPSTYCSKSLLSHLDHRLRAVPSVRQCWHKECMEFHMKSVSRELCRKSASTTNEGDLFAVCLVAFLSGAYENTSSFLVHLKGSITIMRQLTGTSKEDGAFTPSSGIWHLI